MWQTLWFQSFQCEILVIFTNSYTILKLLYISHIVYIEMVEITQFPSLMFTYCQTTVHITDFSFKWTKWLKSPFEAIFLD
jgi:hypothetical protein